MSKQRPNLRNPTYGEITQGTVFCCAYAPRYQDCAVYGLTITSRCDVAQGKYPILNYLPIVSLSDWLRQDGLDILLSHESNEQFSRLKRTLHHVGVSSTLLESISLNEIADVHFPLETGKRTQKKTSKEFRVHISLMEEFDSLIRSSTRNEQFLWFRKKRPSSVKQLISRLSRHNVLGHYFLEALYPDTTDFTGYVCLLREVTTLSKKIADELGRGLSFDQYNKFQPSEKFSPLVFDHEELAMPIVEIGSPTIEHILQSFSYLFGRIGIPDPVENVVQDIAAYCMSQCRGDSTT